MAEQQVLLAVQHDHLVPLRSVVPLADGREALVFDLVRGAQLAGMVRSRGHLRPGEVVTVLTPVCEAVAHLHAAGGLHADISPANITVTPDGRPVLLDLGAARVAGREPGAVHGTPGFVAPEVRLGSEPDEAADVYALGAVAWFCLTGNGAPDTMIRLDHETVVSHVGAGLADVVAAAIDPEPGLRPGAAELARLFYDAVPPEPVEVVVGSDEASALTHRLRADAGRDPCVIGASTAALAPAARHLGRRRGSAAGRQRAGRWRHAGPTHARRRNPSTASPGPQPERQPARGRRPHPLRRHRRRPPTACSATRRVRLRGPRSCCRPSATAAPPRWSLATRLRWRTSTHLVRRASPATGPSSQGSWAPASGGRGSGSRWPRPCSSPARPRRRWCAPGSTGRHTSSSPPTGARVDRRRRRRASARLPPRARSAGVADQRDQRRTSHLTAPSRSGCSKVNPEASSASGSTRWLAMT